MKKRTKSRIALTASGLLLTAAAGILFLFLHFQQAANPSPSPNGVAVETAVEDAQNPFPVVDWNYWQSVNPDVIGWVTIPGTDVNHPIVQAHADAPDFYLKHDVYKDYNPLGAIYLDADCEELGLSSRNAVILGHHVKGAAGFSGFSAIASYKDAGFAKEHATVLIQTPTAQMEYTVRFSQIVKGWEPLKRTAFEGDADFQNWYDSCRSEAAMVLDAETEANQTISLVSCSYNYWAWNERTVVVASPMQEPAENPVENTQTAPDGL